MSDRSFPNGGVSHQQLPENTSESVRVSVVTLAQFRLI